LQAIADLTGPDGDGVTAASTIRESLLNVNVATANIADDTEALKHNFLIRGFFNKRGYYSLAGLTPDQYRKDRSFAAPNSDRAWLTADQLFHAKADGVEELTSEGQSAINSAVKGYGGRILESPIMVEGYADTDDTDARVALSRRRAILVRNYLQGRFSLDSAKIGALSYGESSAGRLDSLNLGWRRDRPSKIEAVVTAKAMIQSLNASSLLFGIDGLYILLNGKMNPRIMNSR